MKTFIVEWSIRTPFGPTGIWTPRDTILVEAESEEDARSKAKAWVRSRPNCKTDYLIHVEVKPRVE